MSFFSNLTAKLLKLPKKSPSASASRSSSLLDLTSSTESVALPVAPPRPASLSDQELPSDALRIVQLAISLHENGRLEDAFYLESLGAEMGDPLSLFLYGMALREGHGTARDEAKGLVYLKKAGELSVKLLDQQTQDTDDSAATGGPRTLQRRRQERLALRRLANEQLASSAHEIGQSILHGWGTKPDPAAAMFYFQIAAELGDPDALVALADAYLHGVGVKSNKKRAAGYYRLARKRGALKDAPGFHWVDKEKYDAAAREVESEISRDYEKDDADARVLGLQNAEAEAAARGKKWWH